MVQLTNLEIRILWEPSILQQVYLSSLFITAYIYWHNKYLLDVNHNFILFQLLIFFSLCNIYSCVPKFTRRKRRLNLFFSLGNAISNIVLTIICSHLQAQKKKRHAHPGPWTYKYIYISTVMTVCQNDCLSIF